MSAATQRVRRLRPVFYFVVVAAAVAVGAVSAALLPAWAAGALGVLAGVVITRSLEIWDDRHASDLVAIFEEALD